MGKVAGEERKHHFIYLQIFKALVDINPSHALISLESIVARFEMPGASIPGFADLSTIQERAGLFGPAELGEIITLVCDEIKIETLAGLTDGGERARDSVLRRNKLLPIFAERRRRQPIRVYTIEELAGLQVTI